MRGDRASDGSRVTNSTLKRLPVMKRFTTLLCLAFAVCASGSSVLHASDDPPFIALASSSYYGRFGFDEATDLVVDADGFVYVAGWSESFGGTGFDGFVVKLSPDGSQVVYSKFLGGSGFDVAMGLAVNPAGGVYVVGHTTSTDFPLVHAFQTERQGDSDVWIAQLDTAGALVYSTYYGGSSFENGMAIAAGPTGAIYITGSTGSLDLPAATGFQQAHGGGSGDGFVVKINPDGSGPVYATYLGGSGEEFVSAIAVDAGDRAYIAGGTGSLDFPIAAAVQAAHGGGNDGFLTKLSPDGAALIVSTYLGGFDGDTVIGMALDQAGAVYLTGSTWSWNFPTSNAYQPYHRGGLGDGFLTKLTPDGLGFEYSTFFGGDGYDVGVKVVVDGDGKAQIAGETDSFLFPLVGAVQEQVNWVDTFYAKFSTDGQALLRSTPLGGSGFDVAHGLGLSPSGDVWMAGRTDSLDFPLVNAFQPDLAGSADAFVSRLTFTELPPNQPPVAAAGDDQVVFTAGCATEVVLDASLSRDPDGDHLQFTWSGDLGTMAGPALAISLVPGTYTFTVTVEDGRGGVASDTVNVMVIDNVAPEIGTVSPTPGVLGPPNHQMVDVSVGVSVPGACDAGSTCRVVSVSSNEPVNGLGDGDTAPDWEVTGPLTLRLRAERGQPSQGRIYTITIECVDAAGNASQRAVTVTVPRS
jgi:hypothetical protein